MRVRRLDYFNDLSWGPWRSFFRAEGLYAPAVSAELSRAAPPLYPTVSLWTSEDGVVLSLELPGVDLSTLGISIHAQTLTLTGDRKPAPVPEQHVYLQRERESGPFTRSVELPFGVQHEAVRAMYRHGILEIQLPRAADDPPRRMRHATA